MDQEYVPRAIDAQILAFIRDRTEHKQVLLVEGARQVGKTMLLQNPLAASGKRAVTVNLERDALLCSAIDTCAEFKEFAEVLRDRTGFSGDSDSVLFVDHDLGHRSSDDLLIAHHVVNVTMRVHNGFDL